MLISRPMLPPRNGYVEVEVDGEHRYRNVVTGRLLEDEQAAGTPTAEQILAVLLGGEQDG